MPDSERSARKRCHSKECNTHICKCYKFAKESTCIKLPEEDTLTQLKHYTNMLESPYTVYAVTECSLIPTNDANTVTQYVVNSA